MADSAQGAAGVLHGAGAVEHSARFWLRAYPRRYREARGEELLGLLLDLTPPAARGVGARTALNLVWSGWRTRLRTRPPLGAWLLYRLFDRRIRGHQAWVRDDVEGALGPARRMILSIAIVVLLFLTRDFTPVVVVLLAPIVALRWRYERTQARKQHLVARPGEPFAQGTYLRVPTPRRRVAARAGLRWVLGATVLLGAAGAFSVLVAPDGIWTRPTAATQSDSAGFEFGTGPIVDRWPVVAAILGAAVLGLAIVPLIRRRLRSAVVTQAERAVVGMQPAWMLHTVGWAGLVGAVVVAEILGGVPLFFGVGVATGAAFVLPGLLAARAALRGSSERTALVDVWQHATRGRTYPDAPAWRLELLPPGADGIAGWPAMPDPPYPPSPPRPLPG